MPEDDTEIAACASPVSSRLSRSSCSWPGALRPGPAGDVQRRASPVGGGSAGHGRMYPQSTHKRKSPDARHADFWPLCRDPHDQMTPEQQEGYRALIETRGQLGGPGQDLGAQSQAGEGSRTARRAFSPRRVLALGARARDRRLLINTKWHSAYPTNAHERRGKEVGLSADKVEALIS